MRNAETRLRMLTNSPVLSNQDNLELLPQELPLQHFQPTELMAELQLAVQHRAEIDVTLDKIRSSEVRLGIAHNDLKPQLNLIVESYVKGLKGDYAMLSSLGGQFSDGTPSYAAGLAYEGALGNRAAQAKVRKRTLELHQLMHDFRNVMQTVSGEVEIAAREREAAYREVLGHQRAVVAQDAEVCYLLARWRELPGHDRSAALILEDALNAQDRLTQAEASLAQSQRDFSLAVANLRRATGTLLDTKPARFCAPPQESGKWSQAATMPTSAKPSAAAATRPAVQAPARAASDRTASKPSDQFVPLGLQPPTTTAQRPTGGDYRRN
jgi:outer membrane protein TolC